MDSHREFQHTVLGRMPNSGLEGQDLLLPTVYSKSFNFSVAQLLLLELEGDGLRPLRMAGNCRKERGYAGAPQMLERHSHVIQSDIDINFYILKPIDWNKDAF